MRILVLIGVMLFVSLSPAAAPPSLIDAIRSNQPEQVGEALSHGADVNQRYPDNMNATPLMVAVAKNNPEITRMLLAAGADVNAIDENGDPAINWAAYYGLISQVEIFIEHGADTHLVGHGDSLDIAMRRGHQDLVVLLVTQRGTLNRLSVTEGELQSAIDGKDIDAASRAIAQGAGAASMDETGRPLIARAARTGSVEMVLLLKESGAQLDAADPIGFTALMEAARLGDAHMAEALLKEGANPNHKAHKRGLSFTPVHQVAVGGDLGTLEVFKKYHASLDARDSLGNTPALWALYEGAS
ncbi:MAG: hypothetical protein GY732_00765, partial [Gammaproteobacteria bacterium]|nr:hypothetical protein [Gammaproteobacteria bacterium]